MNNDFSTQYAQGDFDWVIVMLLVIFVIAGALWLMLRKAEKRSILLAQNTATKIAADTWQVIEGALFDEGNHNECFVLHLKNQDKQELRIPFRPAHPSMRQLKLLQVNDTISFEYTGTSLTCALPQELCAYLQLKS